MIIQRIFGFLYICAGIAKAFPQIENVPQILREASIANQGSLTAGLSSWLAQQATEVTIFSGIVLFLSGLALLLNIKGVKYIIYLQMLMMVGFITLLYKSQPQVLVLDAIFMAAAIYMLRYHNKIRISSAVKLPSVTFESTANTMVNDETVIEDAYDVVIIGAGVSGLTSALELNCKVLVIEKAAVLGGNARFETRQGLKYPTAGVCFQLPRKGSAMEKLLKKLSLFGKWKDTGPDTIVFFDTALLMKAILEVTVAIIKHPGELLKLSVWRSTSTLIINWIIGKPFVVSPKSIGDPVFDDLFQFLERFSPESGQFPEMPFHPERGMSTAHMTLLDNISLYSYLFEPDKHQDLPTAIRPKKRFGKLVECAIETTLRVECLSIKDVSAYVGIHFLIGYLKGTLVTLPGGNGSVTEALLKQLRSRKQVKLITGANVKSISKQADILFTKGGSSHVVRAKQIIWAAPKYAFQQLQHDCLPESQRSAMAAIAHHDYCLANVYLDRPVLASYFGGYAIEPYRAHAPLEWVKTGVCLVPQWMDNRIDAPIGILTLLKPIASIPDQGKLSVADFSALQQATYKEIVALLAARGINGNVISDIKLWAWPKGLVVSTIGQQAAQVFATASAPIALDQGQIVFANQDSIGIGNIESSVEAAIAAVSTVKTLLAQTQPLSETSTSEQ